MKNHQKNKGFFALCGYMNQFLCSSLFSILLFVITIIYSVFCLICRPLPLAFRCRMIDAWTISMIALLKWICRVDYQVEGLENIPQDRVGVVFSKHQSTWETFFLPRYFRQAAIILKRELLWVPFFGWGLANTDPIAINRNLKSSAMEQIIKKGKAYLAAGRWIIVYPEGTRISPGKNGNFRPGGARLAVAAECPIIPVAHNAGYFWPKRGFIKRPGTIHVVFGPVIETKGRTVETVLAEATQWIENKMLVLDAEARAQLGDLYLKNKESKRG